VTLHFTIVNGSQLRLSRGCTPVVDVWHEKTSDKSVVHTIAAAIADTEGVDITDLPPLHESIDTTALNQLLHSSGRPAAEPAILGFTVDTWNVFVRADGRIRVCDATTPTDQEPIFADSTP